ncbi:hypothetical protein [Methanocella paludicola]|uniref:hypothetical protein n=1 Tax=Methanocella paludicola TaxID=570267 RepID=UPI000FFBAAD8|nr:hypothetical protein [Methanocella paludicola]
MEVKKDVDYCFVVPIKPDKVLELKDFWREAGTKKAGTMDVYLRNVGQSRVMAFLETMEGEHYLTQYIRGSEELRTILMKNRGIDLPVADFIFREFQRFAGYDITAPENIPDLELLFDWTADRKTGEAMTESRAYAVMLLPEKAEEAKRFYARFREEWRMRQLEQYIENRVIKVLSFLQHRPEGDYIVEYVETAGNIDEVAGKIMRSEEPVFKNMKETFARLTGIDLADPRNMPRVELLFDWSADHGFRIGEAAMARSA